MITLTSRGVAIYMLLQLTTSLLTMEQTSTTYDLKQRMGRTPGAELRSLLGASL